MNPNMLDTALAAHQSGQFAEAEALYRGILNQAPGHAAAWHYLGVLYLQCQHYAQAEQCLGKAIGIAPEAAMYGNFALILKAQGKLTEARAACEQAIMLAPNDAIALNTLGNILLVQQAYDEARLTFIRATSLNPALASAWHNLGLACKALALDGEAMHACERCLALAPDMHAARPVLAGLYLKNERLEQAEQLFRAVLQIDPNAAEASLGLGQSLSRQGRFQEAIPCYDRAIGLLPGEASLYFQLAYAHQKTGAIDAAVSAYQNALSLEPGHAGALNNLANLKTRQGRFAEAEACFRTLLGIDPADASAHGNLGIVLKSQGRYIDAIESYRKALQLNPAFAHAHNNLAAALKDIGEHEQALHSFGAALAIDPRYTDARSNLLFSLTLSDARPLEHYLEEARCYGTVVAGDVKPYQHEAAAIPSDRATANRPLRVGFVSGDFKSHPVGYFIEGLLRYLDRARILPFAYVTDPTEDRLTARIKPEFAQWTSIAGLSDDQAAAAIFADKMDILVDLSGHTANNRLPIFARKPAPLQVSWLGYFASTGVEQMDYFLADTYSAPSDLDPLFTEALWRLPETRLCFTPPADAEPFPVRALPALSAGCITFGSYQNLSKMSDDTLQAWAAILRAVPHSRLRLQNTQLTDPSVQALLGTRLRSLDIPLERVTMQGNIQRAAYLESYANIDLVLDSFPFPGGTTTCEALWMGVPTVTMRGRSLIARQGASLLHCAGLPEWIAGSPGEFVELAVRHASDVPALARLRSSLRQQVTQSPLCDAERFAGHLTEALEGMWQANN